MLTQERLKYLLDYDHETGVFTKKTNSWNNRVGDVAGTIDCAGYLKISLDNEFHYMHRLAWLFVYGFMPEFHIDHINTIRTDNRILNLRDVPLRINIQNQKKATKANKSTGLLGAFNRGNSVKCRSSIKINGKAVYLGTFDTPELAHSAYIDAKRIHHEGNTL